MKPEFLSDEEWRIVRHRLGLTPREFDVLEHLVAGAPEKKIAAALGIKLATVHTHIRNIYRKTRVQGRVGLSTRVFAAHLNKVQSTAP